MQSDPITQEPMPQLKTPDDIPAALPLPSGATTAHRDLAGRSLARRILVLIFKLGLFAIVIATLIAAVYFGWPIVYTRYILPVRDNTAKLAVLETHQQAGQEQVFALQTQLPALAAAHADQSSVMTAQASRIGTLESAFNDRSQALTTSQTEQAAALTALAPRVNALESAVKEHSRALAALQSTQTSLQAKDASGRAELERQASLLKSMELLSRARLFLYESNFGLAKQDIQAARDLLAGLPTSPDRPLDPGLAEVTQRLDQALSRLPDFPVAASDDLDIAWQLLLGGQPGQTATPTLTPEAPTLTPTP